MIVAPSSSCSIRGTFKLVFEFAGAVCFVFLPAARIPLPAAILKSTHNRRSDDGKCNDTDTILQRGGGGDYSTSSL
jgi:hypothetical protein